MKLKGWYSLFKCILPELLLEQLSLVNYPLLINEQFQCKLFLLRFLFLQNCKRNDPCIYDNATNAWLVLICQKPENMFNMFFFFENEATR